MKKILSVILFGVLSSLSWAQTLAIDSKSVVIEWEAYKFSSMAPVTGVFDSFMISGLHTADKVENLFDGVSVLIDAHSVNSNNPVRDQRLVESYFQLFSDRSIRAWGNGFDGKKMDLTLHMNGKKATKQASVEIKEDKIIVKARYDMLSDFVLDKAYKSIHEACKALHTGPDGKAVTGTEFQVTLTAKLMKL